MGASKKKNSGIGLIGKLFILLAIVALGVLATVRFEWKDQALFGLLCFALALWSNAR